MKTFTFVEYGNYTIAVSDDVNKVHHAVDNSASEYNKRTLYPYEPSKHGGLDNVCDTYTLQQVKNRMKKRYNML